MTNTTTGAIAEAARLLREDAESLKAAHTTPASYGADWGDDEDALEEYCHMHEVALALERVPDHIERLTTERDAAQRRRTELGVMLVDETRRAEKAEAERDAALEDAQDVPMLRLAVKMLVRAVRGTPGGVATLGRLAVDCPVAMSVLAAQKGDDQC